MDDLPSEKRASRPKGNGDRQRAYFLHETESADARKFIFYGYCPAWRGATERSRGGQILKQRHANERYSAGKFFSSAVFGRPSSSRWACVGLQNKPVNCGQRSGKGRKMRVSAREGRARDTKDRPDAARYPVEFSARLLTVPDTCEFRFVSGLTVR